MVIIHLSLALLLQAGAVGVASKPMVGLAVLAVEVGTRRAIAGELGHPARVEMVGTVRQSVAVVVAVLVRLGKRQTEPMVATAATASPRMLEALLCTTAAVAVAVITPALTLAVLVALAVAEVDVEQRVRLPHREL